MSEEGLHIPRPFIRPAQYCAVSWLTEHELGPLEVGTVMTLDEQRQDTVYMSFRQCQRSQCRAPVITTTWGIGGGKSMWEIVLPDHN